LANYNLTPGKYPKEYIHNLYFIQNLCGLTFVFTKFCLNILFPLQAFGAYKQTHISFNIQKHTVKMRLLCSKRLYKFCKIVMTDDNWSVSL